MKRAAPTIALVFVALLAFAAPHSVPDDLDGVMHLLAARQHGAASFVEQHFLSLLKRPLESSGVLLYEAPNRLEKRTLEPRPESLLLQGNVLTVQRGRSSHVLDMQSYPQIRPFIDSIRATLAGDRNALERVFRVEFAGDLERWTLRLRPLEPQAAKNITEVQIDGMRDDLIRVEIKQPDGDRSLMTLRAGVPSGVAPLRP